MECSEKKRTGRARNNRTDPKVSSDFLVEEERANGGMSGVESSRVEKNL